MALVLKNLFAFSKNLVFVLFIYVNDAQVTAETCIVLSRNNSGSRKLRECVWNFNGKVSCMQKEVWPDCLQKSYFWKFDMHAWMKPCKFWMKSCLLCAHKVSLEFVEKLACSERNIWKRFRRECVQHFEKSRYCSPVHCCQDCSHVPHGRRVEVHCLNALLFTSFKCFFLFSRCCESVYVLLKIKCKESFFFSFLDTIAFGSEMSVLSVKIRSRWKHWSPVHLCQQGSFPSARSMQAWPYGTNKSERPQSDWKEATTLYKGLRKGDY